MAPAFVVSRASQRIVAPEGNKKILAFYNIKNTGTQRLAFGEVSTTCGCSVASISPGAIDPGQEAVVSVEGTPPVSGEKDVRVSIQTDLQTTDPVLLHLTMVGNTSPPFVLRTCDGVQFGEVHRPTEKKEAWIETVEMADQEPWISDVTVPSNLSVEGGLGDERVVGELAYRKYKYLIALKEGEKVGEFREEIRMRGRDSTEAAAIRVNAIFRPAVYPIPSRLYASVMDGEAPPTLRIRVKTLVPDFKLLVEAPNGDGTPFDVSKVEQSDAYCDFDVTPKVDGPGGSTGEIAFKTNHPQLAEVLVPFTFRASRASGAE